MAHGSDDDPLETSAVMSNGHDGPIRVSLFGAIEVRRGSETFPLSPRSVGLLVRMAMARQPVRWERLLIDLWGNDADVSKRRSLETLVSGLRKVTGRDGLVFQHDAYRLATPVEVDINVVIAAAEDHSRGQATSSVLATAALLAERGGSLAGSIGSGEWVDELERDVERSLEVLASATRQASVPPVEYTIEEGRHLAYQLRPGAGPTAVVLLAGLATHCEGIWDAPGFHDWVEAAVGDRPFVMYDKRGSGLSDPVSDVPTDAELAGDVVAVLKAAGLKRAVVLCAGEAGMFGPWVAVGHPETIVGAVFINATPRMFSDPDYPHGLPEKIAREFGERVKLSWARRTDSNVGIAAPSRALDPRFEAWAGRYQGLAASPGSLWQLAQYTSSGDGRAAVADLRCPTLVIQSRYSTYFRPSVATWLCEQVGLRDPVWLDSADHLFWVAEPSVATAAISSFLDEIDDL